MAKCLLMCWFSCGEAENPKKTGGYGRDNGDNQLGNRLLDSMAKAVLTVCRHPDRPLPWSLGSGRKTLASLSVMIFCVHAGNRAIGIVILPMAFHIWLSRPALTRYIVSIPSQSLPVFYHSKGIYSVSSAKFRRCSVKKSPPYG